MKLRKQEAAPQVPLKVVTEAIENAVRVLETGGNLKEAWEQIKTNWKEVKQGLLKLLSAWDVLDDYVSHGDIAGTFDQVRFEVEPLLEDILPGGRILYVRWTDGSTPKLSPQERENLVYKIDEVLSKEPSEDTLRELVTMWNSIEDEVGKMWNVREEVEHFVYGYWDWKLSRLDWQHAEESLKLDYLDMVRRRLERLGYPTSQKEQVSLGEAEKAEIKELLKTALKKVILSSLLRKQRH